MFIIIKTIFILKLIIITACFSPAKSQDTFKLCPQNFSVCMNDGLCLIINDQAIKCTCQSPWTGVFCETEVTPTTTTTTTSSISSVMLAEFCPIGISGVCQNGGICLILNGKDVVCSCANSFTGLFCEVVSSTDTTTTTVTSATTTVAVITTATITTTTKITTTTTTKITTTTTSATISTIIPTTVTFPKELPWCQLYDDPHLKTFDNAKYDFMFAGSPYLMFTDYDSIKITAGFTRCNNGILGAMCNCGVHFTFNNATVYLDNCGIAPKDANLKFFSFDKSIGISAFDCNSKTVPGAKETDDTWWKTLGNPVSISSSKFLCAKSQFSGSYIIRTNNNDDTKNVYVKLLTSKNGGIPQLQIRASGYSYRNSGGLCGYYDLNANNDQFIWTKSVTTSQTQLSTVNNMAAFWRLSTASNFGFTKLTQNECPCDLASTFSSSITKSTCDVLLSQCLQKSVGNSITLQDYIRPMTASLTDIQALSYCKQYVGQLDGFIQPDQINELYNACLSDLKATGDPNWAANLLEIGKNWQFENQFTVGTTKITTTTTPAKVGLCPPLYTLICISNVQCLCIKW